MSLGGFGGLGLLLAGLSRTRIDVANDEDQVGKDGVDSAGPRPIDVEVGCLSYLRSHRE